MEEVTLKFDIIVKEEDAEKAKNEIWKYLWNNQMVHGLTYTKENN